jgi:hypothetical protein
MVSAKMPEFAVKRAKCDPECGNKNHNPLRPRGVALAEKLHLLLKRFPVVLDMLQYIEAHNRIQIEFRELSGHRLIEVETDDLHPILLKSRLPMEAVDIVALDLAQDQKLSLGQPPRKIPDPRAEFQDSFAQKRFNRLEHPLLVAAGMRK